MVELSWPAEGLHTQEGLEQEFALALFSLRYANLLSCSLAESHAAVNVTGCTSSQLADAVQGQRQQQSVHIAKAHARIATANALDAARRQADGGAYAEAKSTIEAALVTAKAVGSLPACGADDPLVGGGTSHVPHSCTRLASQNLTQKMQQALRPPAAKNLHGIA